MGDYTQWCAQNGCTHAHCPYGCEHPQPFVRDGVLYCGRCAAVDSCETICVPCDDEVCPAHKTPNQ